MPGQKWETMAHERLPRGHALIVQVRNAIRSSLANSAPRTHDQLATAVRANVMHRRRAGRAESALVAANECGAVTGHDGTAFLASRAHLERHLTASKIQMSVTARPVRDEGEMCKNPRRGDPGQGGRTGSECGRPANARKSLTKACLISA